MKQHHARYSFILTDCELVAIQRLDRNGNLELLASIPWTTKGTASQPRLTVLLGLRYLGMLAANDQGWFLQWLHAFIRGTFLKRRSHQFPRCIPTLLPPKTVLSLVGKLRILRGTPFLVSCVLLQHLVPLVYVSCPGLILPNIYSHAIFIWSFILSLFLVFELNGTLLFDIVNIIA